MAPRTVVVGDLHLCRESSPRVARDLSRLVESVPGSRLVFAGDLFDVSSERGMRAGAADVTGAFGRHGEARTALANHLERGGELWLVAGNHDAEIGGRCDAGAVAGALGVGVDAAARIRTTPWFFREGGLHLEHGHLYDPDNAPAHPLVDGAPSLGVRFTEQFIAPTGAYAYLNVNADTPLRLFLASFRWYGARAPYVIYRYFYTAISALLAAGPLYPARGEPAEGAARMETFARAVGIPVDVVARVLEHAAAPTTQSLARTFTRLYFDRVLATLAMAGGLGAAALGWRRQGAAAFGLGGLLMALSWSRGHDRYSGTVAERLAAGAERVAASTGAHLVVLGHTHREAEGARYANTGSFAFPGRAPGRPYLEIEGGAQHPRAVRRHLMPSVEAA
jgi:predicted phosphodiesterase